MWSTRDACFTSRLIYIVILNCLFERAPWMPYKITTKKHLHTERRRICSTDLVSIETPLKYFNRAREPVLISLRPFVPAEAWLRREGLLSRRSARGTDAYDDAQRIPRGKGGLLCGREMEGKGGRGKRVGGRLERTSARGQVATRTREPRYHRVLTRETSSCHRDIHIHTLLLGPRLDSRQTERRARASTHPLEKRITRLGNAGHEGISTDACGWSGI